MADMAPIKLSNRTGEAADRITSLSDDTINKISMLLPMKGAMRTSLEWTKHWTMVPKLEFIPYRKLSNADFDIFVDFVNKVFSLNKAPVLESFSIDLGDEQHSPDIETWTTVALDHCVKELDITGISRMPECLFGSETLVVLKLSFVTLDVPPFVHLPRLKILHLRAVEYSNSNSDSLARLVTGCSVLEDLKVGRQHNMKYNFTVSAPILKSLHFFSFRFNRGEDFVNEIWLNAPSLKYLIVSDDVTVIQPIQNLHEVETADVWTHCCLISDYLNACRKAQELTLRTYIPEPCPNLGCVKHLEGTFDSLIRLSIRVAPHHRIMLLKLLGLCPKLQDLELEFDQEFDLCEDTTFDALLKQELQGNPQPQLWCLNLKRVGFQSFTGNSYELTLVAYIATTASELETINIEAIYWDSEDCLDITTDLLAMPRLSPACKIIFTR